MFYAIVGKDSREVDEGCGKCGIGFVGTKEEFDNFQLDGAHKIIELTENEYREFKRMLQARLNT
jgi:hypothetical protein